MYNSHSLWARFVEVKSSNDQLKIIKHQILEIYKIETYWFCQNGSPLVRKQDAVHRRLREKANNYPLILIQKYNSCQFYSVFS